MPNDFQTQILDELNQLKSRVERLESEKNLINQALIFEQLPSNATVGKEYVAYRFKCSIKSVQNGQAKTNRIRRVSQKPLKFIKSEVDAVWREITKTVSQKAAEARAKAKTRRRSIINL